MVAELIGLTEPGRSIRHCPPTDRTHRRRERCRNHVGWRATSSRKAAASSVPPAPSAPDDQHSLRSKPSRRRSRSGSEDTPRRRNEAIEIANCTTTSALRSLPPASAAPPRLNTEAWADPCRDGGRIEPEPKAVTRIAAPSGPTASSLPAKRSPARVRAAAKPGKAISAAATAQGGECDEVPLVMNWARSGAPERPPSCGARPRGREGGARRRQIGEVDRCDEQDEERHSDSCVDRRPARGRLHRSDRRPVEMDVGTGMIGTCRIREARSSGVRSTTGKAPVHERWKAPSIAARSAPCFSRA